MVTSFTFGAAPIPELALFTLDWPWSAAADVLGAWLAWQHGAPDELWSNCQLQSAGGGAMGVRTAGMFVGSTTSLASLVASLVAAVGTQPTYRFVGPEQYLHAMLVEAGCENLDVAQCHLAGQSPAGTLHGVASVASSAYVSVFPSSAGVDAFVHERRRPRQHASGARWRDRLRRLRGCHQRREAGRHRLRAPQRAVRDPGQCGHGRERVGGAAGLVVAGAPRHRGGALRRRLRVPELHRPHPRRLAARLLRGQPRPAGVGEGGVRPRRRVPLRPVHPHPPPCRPGTSRPEPARLGPGSSRLGPARPGPHADVDACGGAGPMPP